jgi:perosamine synthetase
MPFNLQAALGYAQFQRLDELIGKKRWIWNGYRQRLSDIPDLAFNPETNNVHNSVWNTALVFGKSHAMTRDNAMAELKKLGLPSRPFFYPLSSLPAYPGREAEGRGVNPIAYDVSERGINLPCPLNLTEVQLDQMSDGLHRLLGYA